MLFVKIKEVISIGRLVWCVAFNFQFTIEMRSNGFVRCICEFSCYWIVSWVYKFPNYLMHVLFLFSIPGKNDGSVNGTRYFKCRSRHGIFVRHDKLILDKKRRGSRKQAKDLAKRHSMGSMGNLGTSPNTRLTGNQSSPNSTALKATAASSAKKK